LYQRPPFSSSHEDTTGIGICFDLVDINGEAIEIARGVYSEWNCDLSKLNDYVTRLQTAYNSSAEILSVKLYLLRLIHLLARGFTYSSKDYNMIKPALKYIEEHFTENTAISVYAEECHISESYLRKKFSEVVGMSPVEYRNELRFSEAKKLYRDGFTLQEISERLGFYDASYFSRIYKKSVGDSLKNTFDIV
jgi:AraC-like DNA-binding protein